jgi:hypothetical protein
MKSLKLFALVLALFTINIAAANADPIKPTDELRAEIVDIMGTNYLDALQADEASVEVLFTVNSKRELIVLSIESEDKEAVRYFKNKLNYKKVDHTPSKPGEIYLLPVKMIKV